MRILLVAVAPSSQSFVISSIFLDEPLALEYIGAGVRENHDIKILDLRVDTEPRLKETLESFQPHIIGCGAFTIEVNNTKKILAEAKKISPGILTVVGGIHATMIPSDFFEEYIDVVVKGEGVGPFRKICACHEKQKSFQDIENIYYRQNGKMVFTREEPYPDLDTLPFPDRTLTAHLRDKYLAVTAGEATPRASIRGGVGCSFQCKFCAVSALTNHKIYTRSIENIIQELASIDEKYIAWSDDELLIEPKRAITLAKEIGNAGIKKNHFGYGRADTIVRHPEVVEEWAKVGMEYIFIGMEGFRDMDLKEMKKAMNIARHDEAIDICHKYGVKIRGGYIVMPDFDKKDFKNMLKYVRESNLDIPSFSIYTPLPGTELWKEKEAELITRNYNYFDCAHPVLPTKLPLKQFYKEFYKLTNGALPLRKKLKLLISMSPEFRRKFFRIFKETKKSINELVKNYPSVEAS